MFSQIIAAFNQFNHLKIKALSLSLVTKSKLEKDRVISCLSKIQEIFPQLCESDYEEKTDTFKLENGERKINKQALLAVEKGNIFQFTWGIEFPFGTKEDIVNLFNKYQESTSLLPMNIAFFDFRLYCVSYWVGHHYALFWNTFFKNSPIFNMFEPQSLLQSDLTFRASLSEDKIAVVEIQSNVRDSEILNNSFEDDILRVKIGIAKTRRFFPGAELTQLITQHIEALRPFIINRFLPGVIAPLDVALTAAILEGEGKEK